MGLDGREVRVDVQDDQRRVQRDHQPHVPQVGVVQLAVVDPGHHHADDVEHQRDPCSDEHQERPGRARHVEGGGDFESSEDDGGEERSDTGGVGLCSAAADPCRARDVEGAEGEKRAKCEGHDDSLCGVSTPWLGANIKYTIY